MAKAESSLATQVRSRNIRLRHFLFTRRVLGHDVPDCPCGWRRQDAKHIVLFCEIYAGSRRRLIKEAGIND